MHCSPEVELQLENFILCYYLLTFTFEKIGKNHLCFFCLEKQGQVSFWIHSTLAIHMLKGSRIWLYLPFLSVKGSDLTDLLITLSHSLIHGSEMFLSVVFYMVLKIPCSLELSKQGFSILGAVVPFSYFVSSVCKEDSRGSGCIFLLQCCLRKEMLVQVIASLSLLLPMSPWSVPVFVQGTAGVDSLPSFCATVAKTLCSSCLKERHDEQSSLLPLYMLVFVFLFEKYLHKKPVCI